MTRAKVSGVITDKQRLDWVLTSGHVLYQYDHGFWHAMNEGETNEEHGDRRARKSGRQAIDGAIRASRLLKQRAIIKEHK